MKQSKANRGLSEHMLTLHQRLVQALSLGIKYYDNRGRKWQCIDAEIQGLAVRSMSSFVSCISSDLVQHPLVKDSITDMVVALEGILQSGNETILSMTVIITVKLVELLGNSIFQYNVSDLIFPLSRLLCFHQSLIAISCAVALTHILSKLTPRIAKHRELWKAVREANVVANVVCALEDYVNGNQPPKHFKEMASLLRTILWWWPLARYSVFSNAELLAGLGAVSVSPDPSIATAVLRLYSALALCGNGAMKILEHGETLVPLITRCMESSQPRSVRVEALKLSQYLARSEKGCSMMIGLCCEPIVKGMIDALSGWRSCSKRIPADQVPLVVEACHSALITRWAGKHHSSFWKLGIDRVLYLLLNDVSEVGHSRTQFPLEELIEAARKGLFVDGVPAIRPYIWDILGWLATHCVEDFDPNNYGHTPYLNVLIACACSVAVDSIHKGQRLSYPSEWEPAIRAVLMMIFCPSKYIASQARHFLSELLIPNGKDYLEYLLHTLKSTGSVDGSAASDGLRTVTNLIGLACFSSLPQYRCLIIKNEGIKILLSLINRCLSSEMNVRRSSIVSHLHNTSEARTCCWIHTEDWEDGHVVLFYSLWALAELIWHSDFVQNLRKIITSGQVGVNLESKNSEAQILFDKLQNICANNAFSQGLRCYAAYCLRFFGFYGFPSRFGERIRKALNENELADLQLLLSNGQSLGVHRVILMARCPNLLPPKEKMLRNGSADEQDTEPLCGNFRREVRLSSRVDNNAMMKLLEFVYTCFLQVSADLEKQLMTLARRCNSHYLLQMLYRKRPKWGSAIPSLDFTVALGPAGHPFSDVILEAKATEGVTQNCNVCLLSTPHMHVHKVILWSSCDYLHALFQSGMRDSHSQTIKVPIHWESLVKLVRWFYSGVLPDPTAGCLWDNMDTGQQLHELQPYIELCWLSEFWFLEDVGEDSTNVVLSRMKHNANLSLKIIGIAASLSQRKIIEAAANFIAPMYPQMRDSGDLEVLGEELVDKVRVVYVHLSQVGQH